MTGYFGQLTQAAVAAFQTHNGLEAVGSVGPKTRALLNSFAGGTASSSGAAASSPASSAETVVPPLTFGGGGEGGGGGPSSTSAASAPDTTPPSVALTVPVASSTVFGSTVTLTASASDNVAVGNVQFKVDGVNIGSAITTSPYATSWNSTGVGDGSHTLYAVAEDTSGNYATSSISVTVDNTPPVISSISAGTPGETSATITWTTNENSNSQVNFGTTSSYGSTTTLNSALVTSHSIVVAGLTANTTYHYRVRSADGQGNLSVSSDQAFTTAAVPDTTAPSVSLTSPSASSTVSGLSVTLTANASDNVAVASVQFRVDGTNIGSAATTSPYSVSWNSTGVADGSHTLYAVAEDTSSNYATSSISVTVRNSPPIISSISSGTPTTTSATITWTTDEAANSQVNYGATASYGTASSSANLVTSHSVTLTGLTAATTYHFQVQSVDGESNTATSSDQTFTTPVPAWVSPGASIDIDLINNRAFVAGQGIVSPSTLLSITRAASETVTGATGIVSYAANNTLAQSSAGLQAFPASTNLLEQSQAIGTTPWTYGHVTAVNNTAVAPDGTMTASTVTMDGSSNTHYFQQAQTYSNGISYTASGYFQAGTARYIQVLFGGATGAGYALYATLDAQTCTTFAINGLGRIVANSVAMANNWCYFSVTYGPVANTPLNLVFLFAPALNSARAPIFTSSGTMNVWGLQNEANVPNSVHSNDHSNGIAADRQHLSDGCPSHRSRAIGGTDRHHVEHWRSAGRCNHPRCQWHGVLEPHGLRECLDSDWRQPRLADGRQLEHPFYRIAGMERLRRIDPTGWRSTCYGHGGTDTERPVLHRVHIRHFEIYLWQYNANNPLSDCGGAVGHCINDVPLVCAAGVLPDHANSSNPVQHDGLQYDRWRCCLHEPESGHRRHLLHTFARNTGSGGSGAGNWNYLNTYTTTNFTTYTPDASCTPGIQAVSSTWIDHYVGHPAIIGPIRAAHGTAYLSGMNSANTLENVGILSSTDLSTGQDIFQAIPLSPTTPPFPAPSLSATQSISMLLDRNAHNFFHPTRRSAIYTTSVSTPTGPYVRGRVRNPDSIPSDWVLRQHRI